MRALPSPRANASLIATCLGLLTLAGCMGPSDDTAEALEFHDHPELGEILTDGRGRTLYVFTNDEPGVSRCYDSCAQNWPPFLAEAVPGGPTGVRDRLTLVERQDGAQQVAYRERPLYYFVSDTDVGQVSGDGRNGVWFVVRKPPSNAQLLNGVGPHAVEAENVTYHLDVQGHYARPTDRPNATGVVMIHEWWGLNDNIRHMARLLASHGYAVLAVDLFRGVVAQTPQEAQAQVAALNQTEANANMRAAADFLRDRGAPRIASLGWCFGGGQSLQLALSGEPLAATIIYYGFLVTDEDRLDAIDWPVLGIFGEADQAISVAQVRAFERALDNVSVANDIYVYPDVGHAFANPSGDAWAPEETKDAWARTLRFLDEHAKG